MLRQVGLLALAALPALGCAKGEEIAPGEIVIFTLDPADAGADAASAAGAGDLAAGSGTGGAGGMATSSPPPLAAGQPPAGNSAGAPSANSFSTDAGTNDAGRSEDRPVDAGS